MGESLLLQVSGVPDSLCYEKMVRDKLIIHFLRRSNGGDGEVHVRYPTEEEGVAILTFDQEEVVERVLTRRHQLEIDGQVYPLEVSRPQCRGMQVSKPMTMAPSLRNMASGEDRGPGSNGTPVYSSQRKPNDTSTGDTAADLNVHPSPLKKTSADRDRAEERNLPLASHGEPSDSSGLASHTAFTRKLNAQQNPGNSLRDATLYKKSDPNLSPKRALKSPPPDTDSYSPTADKSKPPSIKHLNRISRSMNSSVGSSQGKAKERSSEDSTTSNTNHPRWKMAANLNVPSMPPTINANEDSRAYRNSPLVSGGKSADDSILASHAAFTKTQFREDLPDSRQPKKEFAADSSSSQSKLKGTITDEITSSPTHPKSTIRERSHSNPGQPKNMSADKVNSNPKHSKVTTNPNPGKPQNTSLDESYLNPRYPEDLSASSAYSSSLMAAGWSSSSSPTIDSSTATQSKKYLDQSPLSTEFLVDPAVHTYICVFVEKKIDDILGQSDVEMKKETCEGFNRVILTAKSPDRSQLFYKAAREISDIFMEGQRFLRAESINLSNISTEETKNLQLHLYNCGIWSLESPKKKLEMIGPSKDILEFMEKWTSARGDFATFVHLAQKRVPLASPRPPAVGVNNLRPSSQNQGEPKERRYKD